MFLHSPSGSTPPPASSSSLPLCLIRFLSLASLQMVKRTCRNTRLSSKHDFITALFTPPYPQTTLILTYLLSGYNSLISFLSASFSVHLRSFLIIIRSTIWRSTCPMTTCSWTHTFSHMQTRYAPSAFHKYIKVPISQNKSTMSHHVNHSQLTHWPALCRLQLSDDEWRLVVLSEYLDNREH